MIHEPARRLRIAFVIPYFYPAWEYGGQPRSAFELARSLARRGHAIKVLTTDSGGSRRLNRNQIGADGHVTVEGMEVFYYRNVSNYLAYRQRIFWVPRMFAKMKAALQDAEIVHIHELRSTVSVPAYSAARDLGVPYVLSTHGGLRHLGKSWIKTVFDRLWGQRLLRDASAVIAISPVEERDAASLHVDQTKLRKLPNAVRRSDYILPAPGTFRARWNIPDADMILFLGRLHLVKGADVLLHAFERLRRRRPGTHLVIAGNDDGQNASLRRLSSRLKLDEAVTFAGFLEHESKLAAIADSAAVVVPSRSEVFAIAAIEALMCARPVVLSDVCGLYPLPGPEHGVLTFKTENIDDLADKLFLVLTDSALRQHATDGREFVAREFDTDMVARRAERIYSETVDLKWQSRKNK